jgi:hypothetical protein
LPPAIPGLLVAPGPSLVTSVPAPPTSLPAPDPVAIAVAGGVGHSLVRLVHVLAMAVVVGGAVTVYVVLRAHTSPDHDILRGDGGSDAGAGGSGRDAGTGSPRGGRLAPAGVAGSLSTPGASTVALPNAVVRTLVAYEWLFWGAAGVLVATGVGNLGAFAPAIPGGPWARLLAGKLGLVAIALVASLVRTLLVTRARAGTPVDAGALRRAYGLTAIAFGVVAALAVVLAHG